MADATAKVPMSVNLWGDDGIQRGSESVTTAKTLYSGQIMCMDSLGFGVSGADSPGYLFDGILAEGAPITINTGDAQGAHTLSVKRPFRFWMGADTVHVTDIGKALYIKDNQTVSLATGSNTIKVGYVDDVDSASTTRVSVKPAYLGT